MKQIYLSHCSKDKSAQAKATGEKMTPDRLYTDPDLVRFMSRCKEAGLEWAILSDRYGLFRAQDRHAYYEKPPDTVSEDEEAQIAEDLRKGLSQFDTVWFYVRKASFHPFYERVLQKSGVIGKVKFFSDLTQIQ